MSQTERIVYISQCLSEYGFVNKGRICGKFEIDGRSFKRDIDYLRDRCDCDIGYDRTSNTYVAKKPVNVFSHGRYLLLYAYIMGMARSLSLLPLITKEITGKIKKILDPGHISLSNAIIYRFPSLESFDSIVLDELLQAFRERVACGITYAKPGEGESRRIIEPLRFINYDGQWYVLAFCRTAGEKRQFSLSRIRSALRTRSPFITEINDGELDRIISSGYGIMRTVFAGEDPVWVTIRFTGKSAAIEAGKEWHPDQKVKWEGEGNNRTFELALPVESYEEIPRRVLFFGPEAEAVSPPDFRELWLENIRRMHEKFCGK